MRYVYTGKLSVGLHRLFTGCVDDLAPCLVGDAAFALVSTPGFCSDVGAGVTTNPGLSL